MLSLITDGTELYKQSSDDEGFALALRLDRPVDLWEEHMTQGVPSSRDMRKPPAPEGETHRARWSRERKERMAANGLREHYTRRDIGNRDNWTCGICRDPVDPVSFLAPDPRSASIDHICPVAAGGADVRANVRITHLFCNMNRHDDDGFTDDELTEQRQSIVNELRARGSGALADHLEARTLRRMPDPVKARRALTARVARMSEAKPGD